MNITISVTSDLGGIEKIIANCDNLTPEIVQEAGFEVEGYAKEYAPFRYGYLKNSIQSSMIEPTLARIQPNVDYDIYQELGTYKMAAHPFLSPALEMVAGKFLSPDTWSPLIYGGGFNLGMGYGVGAQAYYSRQGGSHKASPSYGLGPNFSIGGVL